MTPVFSIIVPFHNTPDNDRSNFLDELLSTIPDRSDMEVLFIDDHSTLAPHWTPDVSSFSDTRIQVHPAPVGMRYAGSARNHGMSLARGEFLIFVDSDDLLESKAMNRILDRVVAMGDGTPDLVLFRSSSFLPDGTPGSRHYYLRKIIDDLLAHGNSDDLVRYVAPVGKIVRASFVKRHGLQFTAHKIGNDVLFGAELGVLAPSWSIIDETAYLIRQGNDSLTTLSDRGAILERIERTRQFNELVTSYGRGDLALPLNFRFRKHFLDAPFLVTREVMKSIVRREKVELHPKRFARTLKQGLERRKMRKDDIRSFRSSERS